MACNEMNDAKSKQVVRHSLWPVVDGSSYANNTALNTTEQVISQSSRRIK